MTDHDKLNETLGKLLESSGELRGLLTGFDKRFDGIDARLAQCGMQKTACDARFRSLESYKNRMIGVILASATVGAVIMAAINTVW